MEPAQRLQIQVQLPFKKQPRDDHRIASYLARGYRIVDLLRISDGEVLVTFEAGAQSS